MADTLNQLPIDVVIRPPESGAVTRSLASIVAAAEAEGRKFGEAFSKGMKAGMGGGAADGSDSPIVKRVHNHVHGAKKALGDASKQIEEFYKKFDKGVDAAIKSLTRPGYNNAGPAWWDKVLSDQEKSFKAIEASQIKAEAKLKKRAESIVKAATQDGYKNAGPSWWEAEIARQEKAAARMEKIHGQALEMDKKFNSARAKEAERAAKELAKIQAKEEYLNSSSGVYAAAKIKDPQQRIAEINAVKRAQSQLHAELASGTISFAQYSLGMGEAHKRLNLLESGNVRARGSIHRFVASIASATFEITGFIYGLTTLAAIAGAPALFGASYLKSIEDAKMGMVGILMSMGQVDGKQVSLSNAMNISSETIKQLSDESLKYAVSLEDVTKSFQAMLGPGLAAGMTLQQVGKLATIGTLAVKSMGLDSRQVVQELRDLVAGGIQAASSTLATALGLKDSDIKEAKKSSEGLFAFLEKRLSGFQMAAAERQNTLSGSFDLLKLKIQRLFSDEGGFDALKEMIKSISDSIGTIDINGKLTLNPDLVKLMKSYWEDTKMLAHFLGVAATTMISLIDPAVQLLKAFVAWKAASMILPTLAAIGTSLFAFAPAISTATGAMFTFGVVTQGVAMRIGAMSAASQAGLIGLALYGTYSFLDHMAQIDDLFSRAETRIKNFQDKIKGYDLEQLKFRRMKIQASKEQIEADNKNNVLPRRYEVDGVMLFSGSALETLKSQESLVNRQIDNMQKKAAESTQVESRMRGAAAEKALAEEYSKGQTLEQIQDKYRRKSIEQESYYNTAIQQARTDLSSATNEGDRKSAQKRIDTVEKQYKQIVANDKVQQDKELKQLQKHNEVKESEAKKALDRLNDAIVKANAEMSAAFDPSSNEFANKYKNYLLAAEQLARGDLDGDLGTQRKVMQKALDLDNATAAQKTIEHQNNLRKSFHDSTIEIELNTEKLREETRMLELFGLGARTSSLAQAEAAVESKKFTSALTDEDKALRLVTAAQNDLISTRNELTKITLDYAKENATLDEEMKLMFIESEEGKVRVAQESALKRIDAERSIAEAAKARLVLEDRFGEAERQAFEDSMKSMDTARQNIFDNGNKKIQLAQLRDWKKTVTDIEKIGHDGFVSLFDKGVNKWKSMTNTMKQMFKSTVMESLYKEFAKPIVLNVIANIAGLLGLGGIAGTAAAMSGGSSAVGAISTGANLASAGSSLYSAYSAGGIAGVGNTLGQIGTYASTALSGGTAAVSTGAMGTGWVAAEGGAAYGAAATGVSGAGAAIVQALPYLAALAVLAKGLSYKTVGSGVMGSVSGDDFSGESYQFKKSTFRGSKTVTSALDKSTNTAFSQSVDAMAQTFNRLGEVTGAGSNILKDFNYEFRLALADFDEEGKKKEIARFMSSMGDSMAMAFVDTFRTAVDTGVQAASRYWTNTIDGERTFATGTVVSQTRAKTPLDPYIDSMIRIFDAFKTSLDGLTGVEGQLSDFATKLFGIGNKLAGSNGMSSVFGEALNFEKLESLAKKGETVVDTFGRLETVFVVSSAVATTLGKDLSTAFGAIGLASTEARERLINLAGGVENLKTQSDFFANNFLTDAERIAPVKKFVSETMKALGYGAVDTVEEFAKLVKGLDLSTEAGAVLRQKLMDIAPLFKQVATYTDTLVEETKKKVEDATSTLSDAYDRESSALQTTIDKFKEFSKSLRAFRDSLLTGNLSNLSPEAKYLETKAQFERTYSLAKAGDEKAMENLQGAAQQFLESSQGYFASSSGYTTDFDYVRSALENAANAADTQVDIAQDSLNEMKNMVRGILKVDETLLTVREALAALRMISPAPSTTSTVPGAVASPVTGNPDQDFIESLYGQYLGRASDAGGMQYYMDLLSNGVAPTQIMQQFLNSPEFLNGSHANGLDFVPFDGYRAELHYGERVQTASQARDADASAAELKVQTQQLQALLNQNAAATTAMVTELKEVKAELQEIKTKVRMGEPM